MEKWDSVWRDDKAAAKWSLSTMAKEYRISVASPLVFCLPEICAQAPLLEERENKNDFKCP
jgi:hypothetical protein